MIYGNSYQYHYNCNVTFHCSLVVPHSMRMKSHKPTHIPLSVSAVIAFNISPNLITPVNKAPSYTCRPVKSVPRNISGRYKTDRKCPHIISSDNYTSPSTRETSVNNIFSRDSSRLRNNTTSRSTHSYTLQCTMHLTLSCFRLAEKHLTIVSWNENKKFIQPAS